MILFQMILKNTTFVKYFVSFLSCFYFNNVNATKSKPKQELTETKKPTEKERLELVEKKVEIQKKRLEIKKEKLSMRKITLEKEKEQLDLADKKVSIRSKQLENKKTKLDMDELLANRNLEACRLVNDKIFSLLLTLSVTVIDEERTILGSEPFKTLLLNGKRRDESLDKLMELIKKL